MKSSLLQFLLPLALASYALAAPMPGAAFSTAITNGQGNTATQDSNYEASRRQSSSETREISWDDPTFSGIMTACGDDNAEILIEQQLVPFYSKTVSFKVSDENDVAQVRNCVMATRAWVKTLESPQTIKLEFALENSLATADLLSNKKVFGFSKKVRFEIALTVPSYNRNVTAVLHTLNENEGIKSLYWLNNEIRDKGALALAKALKDNEALNKLDLSGYRAGDKEAAALVKALNSINARKQVDLSRNSLSNQRAAELAKELSNNAALKYLDLSGNHINDAELLAFATKLKNNPALKNLYVPDNSYDKVGQQALKILKEKGISVVTY